ncbi:MAG: ArsR/SmtB family transcription factor [Angustibacter sp.]
MSIERPPRPDDVRLDATNLRGLAHPVRVRLLGLLRHDGPATATQLAERLELSSAATSYHLRQLAQYGFITEDVGRGQPRERWWKAAHRATTMDLREAATDPESAAASEIYLRSVAQAYASQLLAAVDEMPHRPEPWVGRGTLSDIDLQLTPEQADELTERMWALVESYQRSDDAGDDAAEGSARVTVQLQVFPRPGTFR